MCTRLEVTASSNALFLLASHISLLCFINYRAENVIHLIFLPFAYTDMKPYIDKIIVCKSETELQYLVEVHIMCNGSLSKLFNGKVIIGDPAGQKGELKDYFAGTFQYCIVP